MRTWPGQCKKRQQWQQALRTLARLICYECDLDFLSFAKLQDHLCSHILQASLVSSTSADTEPCCYGILVPVAASTETPEQGQKQRKKEYSTAFQAQNQTHKKGSSMDDLVLATATLALETATTVRLRTGMALTTALVPNGERFRLALQ
ncbi:unnamed protein product, partial [Polarella glacialis]